MNFAIFWDILVLLNALVACLKLKLNWVSCVVLGSPASSMVGVSEEKRHRAEAQEVGGGS